jgi:NAD(P)-dependent dehydrogenase (short-subunit alcohol dehydrogenase family)
MQKTILITGCSSGIGLYAALTLKKRGYRVFASVRKAADTAPLQAEGIETLLMDMEDAASIETGVAEILSKTGGTLDALFSNAGYGVPGAVEDLTLPLIRKQFETNVFGPMLLINLVLPAMRKQGHGRIIQNTSILGVIAMPFRGAYNASKFALDGLISTLRQEMRGTPIHISIIAPGAIETQFRANALKSYQTTLKDSVSGSVFSNEYAVMEKYYEKPPSSEKTLTVPPNAVVNKLILALESPRPKSRYYIGMAANLLAFLRRILPDSALDWIVVQSLKGEQK